MELAEDYERKAPTYSSLGTKLERLLAELAGASDVQVLSVTHRVKSKHSLLKKAALIKPPVRMAAEVHDLLGLRVITYFSDHVDRIAALVESEFEVDRAGVKDKRTALDADRFGYVSVHYRLRLNSERRRLAEWSPYSDIWFEVQIRSALQHAWAEIEHDLGYKTTGGSIPDEFRRRFSRLAGLLEIADEEFVALRDDLTRYENRVDRTIGEGASEDVNQATVYALMRSSEEIRETDARIAELHGARRIEPPELTYARARTEELDEVGLHKTDDVIARLSKEGELIAQFAAAWLNDFDPDVDEDERSFRDERGKYDSLPSGVSLYYLYLFIAASRGKEYLNSLRQFKSNRYDVRRFLAAYDAAFRRM